jgi:tetratricopeptide (TPR) repeat protein
VTPRQVFHRLRFGLLAAVIVAILIVLIAVSTNLGDLLFSPDATPTLTPTPTVADKDIGVIVARFTIAEEDIDTISSDDSSLLSERFSNRLEPELNEAMAQLGLTFGYLGPATVGPLQGNTRAEREASARTLAQAYGADIVVYGVLEKNARTRQIDLQPEYYVVPESFSEALEMTGAFRFGGEIGIDEPLSAAFAATGTLTARTEALAYVVTGLSKYVLEDFEGALSSFELAASVPNWATAEGQEVLHVLLGNAHLKLAQEAGFRCERDAVLAKAADAIAAYLEAQKLAPNYSRAYAGLASANYILGLWTAPDNDGCANQLITLEPLETALDYLEQAESATDQPSEIGVRTKLLMTRAQILYFLWNTAGQFTADEYAGLYDELWQITAEIIRNYAKGDYPSVASLVVEAYILRGHALQVLGQFGDALDEYELALEVDGISAARNMFGVGWIGDCYYQLGDFAEAARRYQEALRIARSLNNEAAVTYFEERRDEAYSQLDAQDSTN